MNRLKYLLLGALAIGTVTAVAVPRLDQLQVDNLNLDGNAIISTDTNGNISLTPNGTGRTNVTRGTLVGSGAGPVISDASGNLSSEATLATSRGGTGQNFSASSGVLKASSGTISATTVDLTADVTGALPLANGGTGQTTATAAFDAISPATTKGDIIVHNGVNNIRVPAGSNGQVLTADSSTASGLKFAAGGGGGGAGVNFIGLDSTWATSSTDDRDFENTVGNWAAYADAAGTEPVDGTGGTPNTTITQITTSHLNGAGSGRITLTTGATRQGEGVSVNFYVPEGYRGKKASIKFPFKITGTVSKDDFKIFVYDVTNASLITPFTAGKILGSQGTGLAYFDVPTTMAQGRLIIHVARASNTGAVTIDIDDVELGPNSVTYGMAGSDWTAYTPTFTAFGTVSSSNFEWRRSGDSVQIRGRFTAGTTTASEARISLPSGLTSSSSIGTVELAGPSSNNVTGAAGYVTLMEPSVNYVTLGASTGTNSGISKLSGNYFSSGNVIVVNATVPIASWSSNVQMAESSGFWISSYLANGTRVTSTPDALGEYRSYQKSASATSGTDAAPATSPSVSDGVKLTAVAYGTAGASGEQRYEVFIGKNKKPKFEFWSSAGKTGAVNPSIITPGSSEYWGTHYGYDPTTGIAFIDLMLQTSSTTGRYVGTSIPTGGTAASAITSGYADIFVSENALMVGADSTQVSTPGTSAPKLYSAKISAASGTPSVSSQSGSWITSITDGGIGTYTINIASGTFTSAPVVTGTVQTTTSGDPGIVITSVSTTAIGIRVHTNGGAADYDFSVIAHGE